MPIRLCVHKNAITVKEQSIGPARHAVLVWGLAKEVQAPDEASAMHAWSKIFQLGTCGMSPLPPSVVRCCCPDG